MNVGSPKAMSAPHVKEAFARRVGSIDLTFDGTDDSMGFDWRFVPETAAGKAQLALDLRAYSDQPLSQITYRHAIVTYIDVSEPSAPATGGIPFRFSPALCALFVAMGILTAKRDDVVSRRGFLTMGLRQ